MGTGLLKVRTICDADMVPGTAAQLANDVACTPYQGTQRCELLDAELNGPLNIGLSSRGTPIHEPARHVSVLRPVEHGIAVYVSVLPFQASDTTLDRAYQKPM